MKNLKKKSHKIRVLVLILSVFIIILIAFLLRSRMFLYGDFYLLPDQGRDLQLAKEIYVDHKIPLIGGHAGVGGLFHGPLWIYMIFPFFLVSGGDPFISLVPLYLTISIGIVISAYYISRHFYGTKVGLLVGLLCAFSNEYITTISFTSNSQVMPLVFLWYLFCIINYLRGKRVFLIPSLLLIGIGIHFESAFAILLIPFTFLSVFLMQKVPSLRILLFSFLAFIIAISNFVLFDIRHGFNMTGTVVNILQGDVNIGSDKEKFSNIAVRFSDRVYQYNVLVKSLFYSPNSQSMYLGYITIILGIGVFTLKFLNKTKKTVQNVDKEYVFLVAILFVSFVLYMLYPLQLMAHYVQSLTVVIILLFILSMQKFYRLDKRLGLVILILYLYFQLPYVTNTLKNNYLTKKSYISNSNGSYYNQLAAVDYIFNDSNNKDFGYFVYDPPIVTYGVDYLMWWRGKTKYNYIPESKKLSTVYLLMTPPADGSPKTHEYWIENVVRTKGKRLVTKLLPGDIKVIKLQVPPNDPPADPNYYINLTFR